MLSASTVYLFLITLCSFNFVFVLSSFFKTRCYDLFFFFFSSRRRHTRYWRDWSSDVCSSDLPRCASRVPVPCRFRGRATATDRKSTRLNSSHANISYAVFCLKKKKNQDTKPRSEKRLNTSRIKKKRSTAT